MSSANGQPQASSKVISLRTRPAAPPPLRPSARPSPPAAPKACPVPGTTRPCAPRSIVSEQPITSTRTYPSPGLTGRRGTISKPWLLPQEITRALLSWYINPIVAQQNDFNRASADTVEGLREALDSLAAEHARVATRLSEAEARLAELDSPSDP